MNDRWFSCHFVCLSWSQTGIKSWWGTEDHVPSTSVPILWHPERVVHSWRPFGRGKSTLASRKNQSIHVYLHRILRAVECNLPTLRVRSWSSLNIFQDEDGAALPTFPEDNGKGVLLRWWEWEMSYSLGWPLGLNFGGSNACNPWLPLVHGNPKSGSREFIVSGAHTWGIGEGVSDEVFSELDGEGPRTKTLQKSMEQIDR